MKTYAIFDLEGCVAFFDRAADRADAIRQLAKEDETYANIDDRRVHELDDHETALMKQWIADGQKTHEWPFEWRSWK